MRGYVPHAAVLPGAATVLTHAGTGTLLAAFAAGLPVICLPLGRDQPASARRVVELGLGRSLSPDASPLELRATVDEVLADPTVRSRTEHLAETMRHYRSADAATAAVERLADARTTQAAS